MRRLVIPTLMAAFALAGAASAQAPQGDPVAAPVRSSSVPDDDVGAAPADRRYDPLEIMCKRNKPRTGSRIVRDHGDERICMTRAEWEHFAEAGVDIMRERDRGVCGANGCGFGH